MTKEMGALLWLCIYA